MNSFKLRRRFMTRSRDTLPSHDLPHRSEQDFHIEPYAPMVHVPDIQVEFFFPADLIPAVDLRPAGDALKDVVTAPLFGAVAIFVTHEQRARTNKAERAPEHIPQLREFIE